jgi:integrase
MSAVPNEGLFFKPQTLGQLRDVFMAHIERQHTLGRYAARTVRYYWINLNKWVRVVGADLPLAEVVAFHLQGYATTWHHVQSVRRLFDFAVDAGLMTSSPVARVPKPARGRRERILTRHEMVLLLRTVKPAFRRFLIGMRQSLARPQEIRSLLWSQLRSFDEGRLMAFIQTSFKSKRMRRNGGAGAVRVICVDARFRRLLDRLRRQRSAHGPVPEDGFVFLNDRHQPWTGDSVGQAMRLWTRRCGINAGDGREAICAYSIRHMSATLAARNATQAHVLAALMGHSSPVMTARYIHPSPEDLAASIDAATKPNRAG